ncbi:MAG: hypothetical protein V9E94_21385 [Microthrixaceae bacterium]
MLGELTVGIERRVVPDEPLAVVAQIAADGRKRTSGSVAWDTEGVVVVKAHATWVVLDESHFASFGVKTG